MRHKVEMSQCPLLLWWMRGKKHVILLLNTFLIFEGQSMTGTEATTEVAVTELSEFPTDVPFICQWYVLTPLWIEVRCKTRQMNTVPMFY